MIPAPENTSVTDFNWTTVAITGLVLLNAERDSAGDPIDPHLYYYVGKHKVTGNLVIIKQSVVEG